MEHRMPGLAALAGFFRWVEELLTILNGPLLMFGGGIALVDLLTDGALTTSDHTLLFAWAISQAVGVDTQVLGTFARLRESYEQRKLGAVAGWLVLGIVLCLFAGQAGYVFAIQQSEHVSEHTALRMLQIDPLWWYGERAALAVGLIALSGLTRYRLVRVVDPAVRVAEIRAAAQIAEAEAEAARARVRRWRDVVGVAIRPAAMLSADAQMIERSSADDQTVIVEHDTNGSARQRPDRFAVAHDAREERIAQVVAWLHEAADLSISAVADRLHISRSTAHSLLQVARERLAQEGMVPA
jgi:hypothetical protein